MKQQIISGLFAVGALMVAMGAGLYITDWVLAPYIYNIGAIFVAFAQFWGYPSQASVNVKRLYRQQLLGAFFLVLAGVFMLFVRGNNWIVWLTIAAVLELYTAFRIPQEESKERKKS